MSWDEIALNHVASLGAPLLRFYDWKSPCATFGYFQAYREVAILTPLRPLVRRPTGGGLVAHTNDWTYSLALPPENDWFKLRAKESYHRLHSWLRDALQNNNIATRLNPAQDPSGPGACFIGAEEDDLLDENGKIAGAAQRRTRAGFLIQGSIQPPPPGLNVSDWEAQLRNVATDKWGVNWREWHPSETHCRQAKSLAETKYATQAHQHRR